MLQQAVRRFVIREPLSELPSTLFVSVVFLYDTQLLVLCVNREKFARGMTTNVSAHSASLLRVLMEYKFWRIPTTSSYAVRCK